MFIHFGATIIGNFSLRCLSISNDAEPDPIIGPALSSVVGRDLLSIFPTSILLDKCSEIFFSFGEIPPRYITCDIFIFAILTKFLAESLSSSIYSFELVIEWTK